MVGRERRGGPASVASGSTEDERSESSGANEGQRDGVSRGRGMPSGRGRLSVVTGAGCSESLLGGRLLVETVEQLCDVRTVLPAPMRANGRDQRPSLFGAQMSVPSVVDDEPWCRDDPRAL